MRKKLRESTVNLMAEFILVLTDTIEEAVLINSAYEHVQDEDIKELAIPQGKLITGLHFRGKRPTEVVDMRMGTLDGDWFREIILPALDRDAEITVVQQAIEEPEKLEDVDLAARLETTSTDLKAHSVLDWIGAKVREKMRKRGAQR